MKEKQALRSVFAKSGIEESPVVEEFDWPRRLSEKPYMFLAMALILAAAIRLYLVAHYYCISSDGLRYIRTAQDFYTGNVTAGLASVYPPLYPLMIAGSYPLIGDWETTGQIWSTLAGVLLLLPLFALLRRMYGDKTAVMGAFLAAISPFLARYSAHVRTEMPFIFLCTVSLYLFYTGMKNNLWRRFLYAGLIAGLAYLVRPEAVGILVIVPLALALEWGLKNTLGFRAVCVGSLLTLLGFLLFAAPYAVHLAMDTGDWGAISRKTSYALWYGFKDTGLIDEKELAGIRGPGGPGLVQFLIDHPLDYIKKFAWDLPPSVGVYLEAVHYSYVPFLLLGIFHAARDKFWRRNDHLLFVFVLFYILAFAALYVNLRYAIQLVPASLGWVAVGILWCLNALRESGRLSSRYVRATVGLLVVAFLAGTLGKGLRSIAPDKSYVRESGVYLKRLKHTDDMKVLVFDDRITFYAEAQPVLLGGLDEGSVIRTLRDGGIDYVATELTYWRQRFPAIANNPSNYGLVLEKEFNASGKGKLLIYKVKQV